MGILRGLGVLILSFALFGFLLSGNLFLTLGLSTDYDVVKPEMISLFGEIIKEQSSVTSSMQIMQNHCDQNNTEFILSDEPTGEIFVLPCETILNGTDATIEYGVGYLVDEVYYKEYKCDFWDCFSKAGTPAFLLSQKANNYWFSKYYFFFVLSLIAFAGIFFLSESKSSALMIFGGLSILSSLLFIKIDRLASFVISLALGNAPEVAGLDPSLLTDTLSIFFIQSYAVFLGMLFVGIFFIALGVITKFFGWGIKINQFFSKFGNNRKISKKEVEEIINKKFSKKK